MMLRSNLVLICLSFPSLFGCSFVFWLLGLIISVYFGFLVVILLILVVCIVVCCILRSM